MSITWNGVSSDTIGVVVERIPNRYVPTRRFSPQQVAGRNGNILLVDKSFPNVEQEYEVYLSAEAQGLPSVARACAEWLMGPDGYCRLEDSYDTTVYREAFLMGGYDLENILNKFGRCTITFSCKPQKYLLTGDTPIEIPAGVTTYTGDVVQFDVITGASITSLSTTITPTQDLHGYSSPWPAGGGKNLVGLNTSPNSDITYTGVSATSHTDDAVTLTSSGNSTYAQMGLYYTLKAGTYTASVKATSSDEFIPTVTIYSYPENALIVNGIKQGDPKSFTLTEDAAINIRFFATTSSAAARTVTFYDFQLESGSTPTSWTPYSNICPITGRTGLNVYVGPTTAQADATTYAVDWTSEAGTVYGGTLDVVTGVLTVDRAMVDMTAFAGIWNIDKPFQRTYIFLNEAKVPSTQPANILCNRFETRNFNDIYVGKLQGVALSPGNALQFHINGLTDDAVVTTAMVDQYFVDNPTQVCYELATPLTYQLTPQEIEVLVGENNVWTSSGPVSVTVEAPFVGTVTNPTPFEARPMLEVSGVGEITINGKTIQILESVSDFDIDCESMEAEDNSKIYCMGFPDLSGGDNEIVGDGSITALTVTPRWWTL